MLNKQNSPSFAFSPQSLHKQIQQQTQEKSLREAILVKIASSTQGKNKNKYNSHYTSAKTDKLEYKFSSVNQAIARNLFSEKKLGLFQNQSNCISEQGLNDLVSPHPHPYFYQSIEQQKQILQLQSTTTPGFFEYKNWTEFQQKFYSYVDQKYQNELWKILRIINYGQVHIPTGLVFDLHKYLSKFQVEANLKKDKKVEKRKEKFGLKNILEEFLKNNGVQDRLRNFRELQNYIDLESIQQKYANHSQKQKTSMKRSQSNQDKVHFRTQPKSSKYSVSKYQNNEQIESVWNRNFKDAVRRKNQKIVNICDNFVSQQKQCCFKPDIHEKPSPKILSPSKKVERICHHKQKHAYKEKQDERVQENIQNLLKAKSINLSVSEFEGGIQSIPGVGEHLDRKRCSQAKNLKIKRQYDRPSYSKKYSQKLQREHYNNRSIAS